MGQKHEIAGHERIKFIMWWTIRRQSYGVLGLRSTERR